MDYDWLPLKKFPWNVLTMQKIGRMDRFNWIDGPTKSLFFWYSFGWFLQPTDGFLFWLAN